MECFDFSAGQMVADRLLVHIRIQYEQSNEQVQGVSRPSRRFAGAFDHLLGQHRHAEPRRDCRLAEVRTNKKLASGCEILRLTDVNRNHAIQCFRMIRIRMRTISNAPKKRMTGR